MDAGPNFISWLQGLNFNPYSAAFSVLWQALGLPNPLQIFMDIFDALFGGRPKLGPDSATDNTAKVFLASKNPYVRAWGKGVRLLERRGVPLSVSDVAVWARTYGALQNAILRDLQRQMPQMTRNGQTAGFRTWKAYQTLGYSRRCNSSSPDPECPREARRIDETWFIPLVLGGGGGGGKRQPCACGIPSRA